MKSVCLLTRRAGTARAAFRDYYETRHCRLGMKYYLFAKYLRNHVVESAQDIDFDCVSEFYIEDGRLSVDPKQTAAGEILDADERSFMEQRLIRPARAEETILFGPPRDVAVPGTRRQLLLLDPAAGIDDGVFATAISDWANAIANLPGVVRISLDRVLPYAPGRASFPCQAMLSVWLGVGVSALELPGAPATIQLRVALLADVCETPPAEIMALYDPS